MVLHDGLLGKQVFPTYRVPVRPFKICSISQTKTANNEMVGQNGHEISIRHYYRELYGIELE